MKATSTDRNGMTDRNVQKKTNNQKSGSDRFSDVFVRKSSLKKTTGVLEKNRHLE